jgi:uncharacterized glyoxalase superfamily protein PhnB
VNQSPRFNLVDIVAHDFDASVAFYRHLGADIDEGLPGDIRHAEFEYDGVQIHIDNEHLAGLYNASWRSGEQPRVVLGFQVPTREAVDATYDGIISAGYRAVQCPYDAFWGARYAIVADPDSQHVGIMSPIDETMKHWPPRPSPEPAD